MHCAYISSIASESDGQLVQLTFEELAEALTKQANYNCLESAPADLRPPLMGLGFEFDLDERRDVVISASHHTAEQEIVDDVCSYPVELYAAVPSVLSRK